MNKHVKDKWIENLRSGDFMQGWARLIRRDAAGNKYHCVFGVLCETAVGDGLVKCTEKGYRSESMDYDEICYPPKAVYEWSEITEWEADKLVRMNDRECKDFSQLASWIEENL